MMSACFGPLDEAFRSSGDCLLCSLGERQAGVPMCFSATASFVTVGITATAGIVYLTRIRGWRELPLAFLPLLLAGQQVVEGFLWLALPVDSDGPVSSMLTLVFLLYAKVLWPAFAPMAALLIEPEPSRRKIMSVCAAVGAGWRPISVVGLYHSSCRKHCCRSHRLYGGIPGSCGDWRSLSRGDRHHAAAFIAPRRRTPRSDCVWRLRLRLFPLLGSFCLGVVLLCRRR